MPNNNKHSRSEARKNKAQRSWQKNKERKERAIKENESARLRNQEFRSKGLPTPYEQRQRDRAAAKRNKQEA